ncbi:PREDICTED: uncharacterized protein LOC108781873 [Cyphomyrmex costatus]|uniref:uncharacterized protein LOC108781873 n=1 Tax=Cyphomyrmex costatus TaxID=456900 RepID=UPI00085236F5|nr:PREDICTED: uncharacterized protein LOC108781873 [Cyphomyrmex costatus]
MLEKMTCEIDRVQRNYMDPKANHYLHKSANNVLKTSSKPSLQEEAEIVRSLIFPDRKARIKSAISNLRNVDSEIIGKDMARVRFDEDLENVLTDKQPNMTKPKFTDDGKIRAKIRSSIEEYLRHHTDYIRKSYDIEEKREEYSRNVKPSVSDIEDILASHNIGPHVLYENFERQSDSYNSENYASEDDACRSCSNTATNATQVTTSVDTIQENRRIHDMSLENTGLYNDRQSTKVVDAKPFNIRRQSSVTNFQDNAFVKMGLNENLSRDTLSQILQSEYLRKDLSL